MIGWLSRRRQRARSRTSVRPLLEQLGPRVVPAASSLTDLQARVIGDYLVVTGVVSDDGPGLDSVSISGAIDAVTATRDRFEFIVPYAGQGDVSLAVRDDEGLDSAAYQLAADTSSHQAPYVSFRAVIGSLNAVTFTGFVYDEHPDTVTVMVSVPGGGGSAQPAADGSFSVTVTAVGSGIYSLSAADADGLWFDPLAVQPRGDGTSASVGNMSVQRVKAGTIRISGTVTGNVPAGQTVTIGGNIPGVAGQTATVGANGSFEITIPVGANGMAAGSITADVNDANGQPAEQGWIYFVP